MKVLEGLWQTHNLTHEDISITKQNRKYLHYKIVFYGKFVIVFDRLNTSVFINLCSKSLEHAHTND